MEKPVITESTRGTFSTIRHTNGMIETILFWKDVDRPSIVLRTYSSVKDTHAAHIASIEAKLDKEES